MSTEFEETISINGRVFHFLKSEWGKSGKEKLEKFIHRHPSSDFKIVKNDDYKRPLYRLYFEI